MNKKIVHPEFAERMGQACEGNPNIPSKNYGRLLWFKEQLETRFGTVVTQETVRKWFAGEVYPRKQKLIQIAQIMQVDDAWLALGRANAVPEKERKVQNAAASGVVNLIAGLIQICGGTPSFPDKPGKVDLNAIIKGALYSFNITTGVEKDGEVRFAVPVDAREAVVLGVIYLGDLNFQVFELDWSTIESVGERKSGHWIVKLSDADWRRVTTFAERL
ncbi:MAG: hypothetical protein CFE34_04310 [Rhodobacteraceae bacterium PARR1]|nr:MAG: hypothetical protein CFE34_04310 [Rhodobacteraceae bacterium PARR1]